MLLIESCEFQCCRRCAKAFERCLQTMYLMRNVRKSARNLHKKLQEMLEILQEMFEYLREMHESLRELYRKACGSCKKLNA